MNYLQYFKVSLKQFHAYCWSLTKVIEIKWITFRNERRVSKILLSNLGDDSAYFLFSDFLEQKSLYFPFTSHELSQSNRLFVWSNQTYRFLLASFEGVTKINFERLTLLLRVNSIDSWSWYFFGPSVVLKFQLLFEVLRFKQSTLPGNDLFRKILVPLWYNSSLKSLISVRENQFLSFYSII